MSNFYCNICYIFRRWHVGRVGEATFHSFIFALAHLKSVSVMEKRGFTSSICAVSRCRACMQGAAAILRRADAWRELLQSKFPFLCARTIYNSAIELFMCLHRLSLDATGHVWEGGNVFMALFLISQAIFFPSPLLPPNRTPTLHGVQIDTPFGFALKFYRRSVSCAIAAGATPGCQEEEEEVVVVEEECEELRLTRPHT